MHEVYSILPDPAGTFNPLGFRPAPRKRERWPFEPDELVPLYARADRSDGLTYLSQPTLVDKDARLVVDSREQDGDPLVSVNFFLEYPG